MERSLATEVEDLNEDRVVVKLRTNAGNGNELALLPDEGDL